MKKKRSSLLISCHNCHVAHLCVAHRLSPESINNINSIIGYAGVYEPGQRIHHANEPAKYLHAIYQGTCKSLVVNENGEEMVNDFFFEGDISDLDRLYSHVYGTDLIALTQTIVCIIPIKELLELAACYSDIQNRLLNLLCNKLHNHSEIHLMTNARKRVVQFYKNFANRIQQRNGPKELIRVDISQIDISKCVGIANETFNRILHQLAKMDVIILNTHRSHYVNVKALNELECDAYV